MIETHFHFSKSLSNEFLCNQDLYEWQNELILGLATSSGKDHQIMLYET